MTVASLPAPLTTAREPFVGPGPFEEGQEWLFFGRTTEIGDLISLIWAHPIVLLYAPSGSGKSSLLSAGVSPTLRRQQVQVLPVVRVHRDLATETFGDLPNKYVAAALSSLAVGPHHEPGTQGRNTAGQTPDRLVDMLRLIPRDSLDEHGNGQVRLVVLDQFEEILVPFKTQGPSTYLDYQREFFGQIAEALDDDERLRTVFAIREDYLGEIERLGLELPRGFRTRYRLDFLSTTAAFDAIVGPTHPRIVNGEIVRQALPPHFNETYAHMLVERLQLTPKVAGQASYYVEPAELQVVCRRGWRAAAEAGAAEVTAQHLPGDVVGALRSHYESAIEDTVARWLHGDWPPLTARGSERPPPLPTRRAARFWTNLPWSRHSRYRKRLRRFFGRELVVEGERRQVLKEGPEVKKIDHDALDWLRQFWGILRRETRSGSEYLELSLDGLVKPIRDSNRDYEDHRRGLQNLAMAILMILLIPASIVTAWMLGSEGENTVRRVDIESITRFSDRPIRLAELYDGNPSTFGRWEPAERRAKLIVTLEEDIELVRVVVVPGEGGFSPQTVLLGEGIGLDAELDVTTAPHPAAPVGATYCCGAALTLIVDLPESERTLSIAEIEIWGRSPATNGAHREP